MGKKRGEEKKEELLQEKKNVVCPGGDRVFRKLQNI